MLEFRPAALIATLADCPARLTTLVAGVEDEARTWQPNESTWSIHTIVCHLLDEERRDFRPRLQQTLRDPDQPWEPIDPEHWAPGYATWRFAETVDQWCSERRASITWLRTLGSADWRTTHTHPRLGAMSAGDLLLSWCQHDLLHLRQIVKRLYQLAGRDGQGFSGAYAGSW